MLDPIRIRHDSARAVFVSSLILQRAAIPTGRCKNGDWETVSWKFVADILSACRRTSCAEVREWAARREAASAKNMRGAAASRAIELVCLCVMLTALWITWWVRPHAHWPARSDAQHSRRLSQRPGVKQVVAAWRHRLLSVQVFWRWVAELRRCRHEAAREAMAIGAQHTLIQHSTMQPMLRTIRPGAHPWRGMLGEEVQLPRQPEAAAADEREWRR